MSDMSDSNSDQNGQNSQRRWTHASAPAIEVLMLASAMRAVIDAAEAMEANGDLRSSASPAIENREVRDAGDTRAQDRRDDLAAAVRRLRELRAQADAAANAKGGKN